jgi:UPF0755 protein
MPRRRRPLISSCVMMILAVACLFLVGFFLGLDTAPRLAEVEFGPPSSGLDRLQRSVYSLQLLLARDNLTLPVDLSGSARPFKILQGESVSTIAGNLQENGLIRDSASFRLFLIYAGLDKGIKSGNYELSPAQTAMEIGKAIQDPAPGLADLRILAGWRVEEVAAALPYTGLSIAPAELINSANTFALPNDLRHYGTGLGMEGFLFPDSYLLNRSTSSAELLNTVINNFMTQITPDIIEGLANQDLDLYQGVILASLVQREAMLEEEQPTIASVFLNRLKKGMKLDSDPTVQYALGYIPDKKTWWKNPLLLNDLKINSPYNTYVYSGLPPGPICSPGLSALRAVAFPAQTPYYFFRARCDGSRTHAFSTNFDEHLSNACP